MGAWGPRGPSGRALNAGRPRLLREHVPMRQAPRAPGSWVLDLPLHQAGKELLGQWGPGTSDEIKEDSPVWGPIEGSKCPLWWGC